MKKIESTEKTLESYLQINSDVGVLTIPFSQRPYEWEDAQVERLFNDLIALYDSDDDIHMLNFFTLSEEGKETKIFDGQQRTITSLLIIGAFIKKLEEINEVNAATQLYENYISQKNHLSTSTETKYKLRFEDNEIESFFYELLEMNNNKEYKAKDYDNNTIKSLVKNFNLIKKLLNEFIEERSLSGFDIINLISSIIDNTNLITITTYTDELAMVMFETLNNTGKQLENYYVLKNDFVIALSEQQVKEKWNNIDSNLSNYDPSSFILALATILTGKSTKKNSLKHIYKKYDKNDSEEMKHLLNLTLEASKKYLSIRNPAQLTYYDDKMEALQYKQLINDVGGFITSQHHPLILAMLMKETSLKEINMVLKYLLNLGIRNFYFNEKRANTIESSIANLTFNIYEKNYQISEIIQALEKETIKDDELKEAIMSKQVKRSAERRLKFILRETYNKIDLDKELEIRDNLNKIHYEHILPKSPRKDSVWLNNFDDDEQRELLTQKVGNATLLLGDLNSQISNKDFSTKKGLYKDSHIPENKKIAKNENWTKRDIKNRTKNLADKITEYLNLLISS